MGKNKKSRKNKKVNAEYIEAVRQLWEDYELRGDIAPEDIIVIRQMYRQLPDALRSLTDNMVEFADNGKVEAVADFEDFEVLSHLSDREQATVARLVSLNGGGRKAIFSSTQFKIHPSTSIACGRALAREQTAHYGLTRRRKVLQRH